MTNQWLSQLVKQDQTQNNRAKIDGLSIFRVKYCKSRKFSVEKYLVNMAIGRKSLMINTSKFPSDLSHHDNFSELSSHS